MIAGTPLEGDALNASRKLFKPPSDRQKRGQAVMSETSKPTKSTKPGSSETLSQSQRAAEAENSAQSGAAIVGSKGLRRRQPRVGNRSGSGGDEQGSRQGHGRSRRRTGSDGGVPGRRGSLDKAGEEAEGRTAALVVAFVAAFRAAKQVASSDNEGVASSSQQLTFSSAGSPGGSRREQKDLRGDGGGSTSRSSSITSSSSSITSSSSSITFSGANGAGHRNLTLPHGFTGGAGDAARGEMIAGTPLEGDALNASRKLFKPPSDRQKSGQAVMSETSKPTKSAKPGSSETLSQSQRAAEAENSAQSGAAIVGSKGLRRRQPRVGNRSGSGGVEQGSRQGHGRSRRRTGSDGGVPGRRGSLDKAGEEAEGRTAALVVAFVAAFRAAKQVASSDNEGVASSSQQLTFSSAGSPGGSRREQKDLRGDGGGSTSRSNSITSSSSSITSSSSSITFSGANGAGHRNLTLPHGFTGGAGDAARGLLVGQQGGDNSNNHNINGARHSSPSRGEGTGANSSSSNAGSRSGRCSSLPSSSTTSTSCEDYEAIIADTLFRLAMDLEGLPIIDMEPDGNCLFRAVSHQVYGDAESHLKVRAACVKHMTKHRARFGVFFAGNFTDHLEHIKQPAIWGDELEIRALEEILDRPIEIYSSDAEELVPMKIDFDSAALDVEAPPPIKLSYHGRNHYNSVLD